MSKKWLCQANKSVKNYPFPELNILVQCRVKTETTRCCSPERRKKAHKILAQHLCVYPSLKRLKMAVRSKTVHKNDPFPGHNVLVQCRVKTKTTRCGSPERRKKAHKVFAKYFFVCAIYKSRHTRVVK